MTLDEEYEKVKAHIKAQSPRFFENTRYPTQLAEPSASETGYGTVTPRYMGELRMFYPVYDASVGDAASIAGGDVHPWNSAYHPEPSAQAGVNRHRDHFGNDVYAPYFPFPYEIPVFAVVKGTLYALSLYENTTSSSDDNTTRRKFQALGNRVWLEFEVKIGNTNRTYRIDYGHLSRFEGQVWRRVANYYRRDVDPGELVGFVGFSGNADYKTANSTLQSPFMVNAGHIHLNAWRSGVRIDPRKIMPKPLSFDINSGASDLGYETLNKYRSERPKSTDWIVPPRPTLKAERPRPPIPLGTITQRNDDPPRRRRVKINGQVRYRRAFLADRFQRIDADSTALLRETQTAYRRAKGRIEAAGQSQPSTAQTVGRDHLNDAMARFRSLVDPSPVHHDTLRWGDTLGALCHRATQALVGREPASGAHPLRALLHLQEALYILMGGPALEAVNRNLQQVVCGIGMRGRVYAVAWPDTALGRSLAVGALHRTSFPAPTAGERDWVISITFGTGALRHATVCEHSVRITRLSGRPTPGQPESEQQALDRVVRSYLVAVAREAMAFREIYCEAWKMRARLSDPTAGGHDAAYARLGTALVPRVTELNALATRAAALTEAQMTRLLEVLAASNLDAFTQAVAISLEPEGDVAMAPRLYGLTLAPSPPST